MKYTEEELKEYGKTTFWFGVLGGAASVCYILFLIEIIHKYQIDFTNPTWIKNLLNFY